MGNQIRSKYVVTVTNLFTRGVQMENTSKNWYILSREDYLHCDTFSLQVAGVNEVGIGYQSDRIWANFLGRKLRMFIFMDCKQCLHNNSLSNQS